MQTIDEIVASAQKATEQSLREAFEAGRSRTASDLKARMTTFFEGLLAEASVPPAPAAPAAAQPAPPPAEEHHAEDHAEGHHG